MKSVLYTFCLGTLLLVGLALWAMARSQENHQAAMQWITALDLDGPAYWPSGTPLRHPRAARAAVDLRHVPWMPLRRYPAVEDAQHRLPDPAEAAP